MIVCVCVCVRESESLSLCVCLRGTEPARSLMWNFSPELCLGRQHRAALLTTSENSWTDSRELKPGIKGDHKGFCVVGVIAG